MRFFKSTVPSLMLRTAPAFIVVEEGPVSRKEAPLLTLSVAAPAAEPKLKAEPNELVTRTAEPGPVTVIVAAVLAPDELFKFRTEGLTSAPLRTFRFAVVPEDEGATSCRTAKLPTALLLNDAFTVEP